MRTSLYLIALSMLLLADPALSSKGWVGIGVGFAFGVGAVFAVLGDLAEYSVLRREGRRP